MNNIKEENKKDFYALLMKHYNLGCDIIKKEINGIIIEELSGYIYHMIKTDFPTFEENYKEDLYQEACLGILEAIPKYNPEKGMITTFFHPYIKFAMFNFVATNIKYTSTYYLQQITQINRFEEYNKIHNIVNNNRMKKKKIKMSAKKYNTAKKIEFYSKEASIHWSQIHEQVLTPNTTEEIIVNKETTNRIINIINRLEPKKKYVVSNKLGLVDKKRPFTYLSSHTGVSLLKTKELYNEALEEIKEELFEN